MTGPAFALEGRLLLQNTDPQSTPRPLHLSQNRGAVGRAPADPLSLGLGAPYQLGLPRPHPRPWAPPGMGQHSSRRCRSLTSSQGRTFPSHPTRRTRTSARQKGAEEAARTPAMPLNTGGLHPPRTGAPQKASPRPVPPALTCAGGSGSRPATTAAFWLALRGRHFGGGTRTSGRKWAEGATPGRRKFRRARRRSRAAQAWPGTWSGCGPAGRLPETAGVFLLRPATPTCEVGMGAAVASCGTAER